MRSLSIVSVVSMTLALPIGAQADEVFETKLSGSGVVQGAGVVEKVKVTGDALLNIARSRSPESEVPADELLAFIVDCESGEARLSVVDTDPLTELVTLADTSEVDYAADAKGGQLVAEMELNTVGADGVNELEDGYLVLAGKFKSGPGDCPVSLSTALSGVIDVTITDDVGTESFSVLVTKGKLSTGSAPIGSLP